MKRTASIAPCWIAIQSYEMSHPTSLEIRNAINYLSQLRSANRTAIKLPIFVSSPASIASMAFQQVIGSFNVITDCALTTNVCRTTQAAKLQKPMKRAEILMTYAVGSNVQPSRTMNTSSSAAQKWKRTTANSHHILFI